MIDTHLPILPIIIPLIAAPVCGLFRRRHLAWPLAVGTAWATFTLSLLLLFKTEAAGPLSYAIGNWAAPWGIEYRIDVLNAFVGSIVSGIAALSISAAALSVSREIADDKIHLFYGLYLLCLTGLLGMIMTGDAFNVFVFLEISSLSGYALVAMGSHRRALTAAYRYLILGTIGGTFFLIGIGFLYMMTGTLNMTDLAERLPTVWHARTTQAAFAFIVVGLSIKIALFPLHIWLPNAYAFAPSIITTFLAGTATKVAVYLLIRFLFTIFSPAFSFEIMRLDVILLPLSLIAILTASTIAIYQQNVKHILAYSSLAQIAYITLGVSLYSAGGLSAGLLHLLNHALIKSGLFMALTGMVYHIGSARLADWAGIGRRMPWSTAAFVIGGLSLIGVPATSGFISKWYLVSAALEQGKWFIIGLVLVSSWLAVIYIWRVVETAYFRPTAETGEQAGEAPLSMLIPAWTLILANIYIGIDTSMTVGVAKKIAGTLLGSTI